MVEVIESYKRVAREPGFLDRFYTRFMDRDADVRARFQGVDMARQRFVLSRAVTLLLQHASGVTHGVDGLRESAHHHGAEGMNIPAYMYDLWIDALVETVAEHDPRFTPDLDASWRTLLRREVAWFLEMTRTPDH